MHQTKFKYEKKKQRAITQRLSKQELWFMCTALPLDEIYPPTKFHNHRNYILEICAGQKSSLKVNKGQSLKKKESKQELWFMCTALPRDEIYPPTKFHNHCTVLEITKGNNSKIKQSRVTVHVHCTPP